MSAAGPPQGANGAAAFGGSAAVATASVGPMSYPAHADTCARDTLPPREEWPALIFDLPELQYPDRINCATELLDAAVARGWGERPAIRAPGGLAWTYTQLLATANRIANVLVDDMGLVAGNRVLLRGPNNPMMAACWF